MKQNGRRTNVCGRIKLYRETAKQTAADISDNFEELDITIVPIEIVPLHGGDKAIVKKNKA